MRPAARARLAVDADGARRPALGRHARGAPRLPQHRRLPGREGAVMQSLEKILDPANYAAGTVLDLAGPLAGGAVILDEVVAPRAPWSAVITEGDVLTIVDVGGNQSADCLLYNANDTAERYSAPDTIAWSGNVYVQAGTVLRSSDGNPL